MLQQQWCFSLNTDFQVVKLLVPSWRFNWRFFFLIYISERGTENNTANMYYASKKDLPWLNVMVFLFCFSSCTNLLLFATSAHILRVVFVFGFLRLVANGVISGSNCRLTLFFFFFEAAIRTCIFSLWGNGAVRTSICGRYFLFSYKAALLNLEAFW